MGCSSKSLVVTNYTIGILQIMICLFCLFYSVYVYKTYHYSIKRSKSALGKSLKILNTFGMIFFVCCSITLTLNIYYWNVEGCITGPINITVTWYLSCFFWGYGQLFSYLLFLNRIKTVFNNSLYQLNQNTIYFLYILLFLYGVLWFCQAASPLLYIKNTITSLQNYQFQVFIHVPLCIIDILIVISMTFIFSSRLYRVMMATGIDQSAVTHNKMIKAAVKCSTLTFSSLLSSLILITVRMVSYQTGWIYIQLSTFGDFWFQIDTIISCVCLLLFLPKTEKGFDILCFCIQRPLIQKVRKNIYDKSNNSQTDLNQSLQIQQNVYVSMDTS